MATAASPEPPHHKDADHRSVVARAALVTGGGFATSVGGVLTAVSFGGVDKPIALAALAAVCLIAGLTMLTAAVIVRGRP
ncbi:hypothetical protein M1L60_20370 [Actinoplanes sp. TRM 88003]|uniref:Uncharacterized protein n=1 Tax=Paractinoplanes aksuensis TaxID=2939490 RepID=A0ABT1DQ30_9ACTN|nr:hypothetical protein [Actinoplanes aksuensis]MCO8272954.1 hypothetical protein [Actinoplanes aksuensis]